jgi:hypothetical protein
MTIIILRSAWEVAGIVLAVPYIIRRLVEEFYGNILYIMY